MAALVRPVRRSDLDQLVAMIAHVDRGMLTMPSTPEAMEARVERSLAAFARPALAPENEAYFLVMEEDGALLGAASVFTNLGVERPFYSYRISRTSKVSPELKVKVELDILHLVNDHHGDTELGSLFVLPWARRGGRGRLLSFARLMLIAADPIRFGARAMAEIRGWTDAAARSPFWEAVGAKFFRMDYVKADELSARDHRFIADLMPRYPIYIDLLPEAARAVVGRAHPDAEAAVTLLRSQGFHFNQVVDIFDAGPCVEAFVDAIDIVRSAQRLSARDHAAAGGRPGALVALPRFDGFAVTRAAAGEDPERALARLDAADSDELLVYGREGGR
jgi:arginine N-succinyltransferase